MLRQRLATAALGVLTVLVSWYLMQLVHEAGHMLHCGLAGGRVAGVSFPVVGFSQTFYRSNPWPLFTVWGGLVWGAIFPLAVLVPFGVRRWPLWYGVRFFAGFCLIVNGAYLAAGGVLLAGDTLDLAHHGTPRWLMVVAGLPACAGGLALWHRLGVHFSLRSNAAPRRRRDLVVLAAVLLGVLALERLVSSPLPGV